MQLNRYLAVFTQIILGVHIAVPAPIQRYVFNDALFGVVGAVCALIIVCFMVWSILDTIRSQFSALAKIAICIGLISLPIFGALCYHHLTCGIPKVRSK